MTEENLLRAIPPVDQLLASAAVGRLLEDHPRREVVGQTRHLLDRLRQAVRAGEAGPEDLAPEAIAARLAEALEKRARPYYSAVINATGVILHTGLGRAPLAPAVAQRLAAVGPGAQRLEIDPQSGERGGRDEGCGRLVRELTGCEAATVVNNNAAATLIILAALARGRGVLLSRGEMVEIGGSYRIPDIMEESGARLVDIGTTNRTHARDYRQAIDENTAMILKVHTSNYRVEGFTKEVEIEELAAIGREHGIPVVHDLGSGSLIDLGPLGRPGEPPVARSIAAGADLVCFSGDKLVGGPQAGIIAGRREAVERCRRHPLFRAFRPGRLIYSALEATLQLYRGGPEAAIDALPVLRRLLADREQLEERARALAAELQELPAIHCEAVPSRAQAGSGSMPTLDFASWAVRLTPSRETASSLAARLRTGDPAIFGRVSDDALLLDLTTLAADEIAPLVAACRAL
ncbi:MAG: L-seryl-tRNA(Sec) selenium transferase [Acidobacteriota bacterium]